MKKQDANTHLKNAWYFLWHEDSVWSWLANIAVAFILVKFVVYPLLGLVLSTTHPIVAVVSGSMEHSEPFDQWWASNEKWYLQRNITQESFADFPFRNGFNKGDIMILKGKAPKDIRIGDILVFQSDRPDPIIHRVVKRWYVEKDSSYYFQTKGDNNPDSIPSGFVNELSISEERVIGTAIARIPLLGWIKILFVDLISLLR